MSIKLAFIGAGYMTREHIRAFKSLPGIELSGIFSRTRSKSENLAAEFSLLHVCDSVTELYNATHADLVIISVPVLKTKEIVLEAVKYPWIQLIEKPVGCNVKAAEEILEAFRFSPNKGFAAFNRRFYSSTKAVLKEQEGSSLKRLICVYDQEDPLVSWEESRPQELIVNWMFVNPIHLIDYFRVLGRGKIVSVIPIVRWNPTNPFVVAARLEYESGDIGIYQAVWGAPGPWAVTLTTNERRWEMRPLEQVSRQQYGPVRNIETISINEDDINFKAGLRLQAEEAIKAIKGQPHSLVTLEDSLETMKLVDLIYEV